MYAFELIASLHPEEGRVGDRVLECLVARMLVCERTQDFALNLEQANDIAEVSIAHDEALALAENHHRSFFCEQVVEDVGDLQLGASGCRDRAAWLSARGIAKEPLALKRVDRAAVGLVVVARAHRLGQLGKGATLVGRELHRRTLALPLMATS